MIIVISNPFLAWEWLFSMILWWAHVTDTPDDRRIIVLSKGIWKGLNAEMFFGGQSIPISIEGASLEWKNAQKKETKNKTSDVINRIIPIRILVSTSSEWCPWSVASRDTSRHHWIDVMIRSAKPIFIRVFDPPWNHFTVPEVIIRAPIAPVKGHGLWSTMWYGWK